MAGRIGGAVGGQDGREMARMKKGGGNGRNYG
jgi:hypothetical protein